MWAGLWRTVNTTFSVIGEFALNASHKVVKLKSTVDGIKTKAAVVAVRNATISERVKKSEVAVSLAEQYTAKCQNATKEAKEFIKTKMIVASSKFDGDSEKKEKRVKQLLENFTVCGSDHNVTSTSLEVVKAEIESNLTSLAKWGDKTKMLWSRSSEEAWAAITNVSTKTNVKRDWDAVLTKLKKHLDTVVTPLANVTLNWSVTEEEINESENLVTTTLEDTARKLVHEHDRLCNASSLLTALPSEMNLLKEKAVRYSATVKSLSERANENAQTTGQYTKALGTIFPAVDSGSTSGATKHKREMVNRQSASAQANAASVLAIADKVLRDVKSTNDTVGGPLNTLRARLGRIKENVKKIPGVEHARKLEERCDVIYESVTTEAMDDIIALLPSNLMNVSEVEKLRASLGSISTGWKGVTKQLDETDNKTKAVEASLASTEKEMEESKKSFVEFLTSKRGELCAVRAHLDALKKYNSSLGVRVNKALSDALLAQEHGTRTCDEVKTIHEDIRRFVGASAKIEKAVAESMEACETAQMVAAEKDEEAQATAAGACGHAEMTVGEGRRAREMAGTVMGYEASADDVCTFADAAVRRTIKGQRAAMRAHENISSALQNIDSVAKRVEKAFNETVTSLSELNSREQLLACSGGAVKEMDGPTKMFLFDVAKLLQFANNSEEAIVNTSSEVLQANGQQLRDALEVVDKNVAEVKSRSEQARAIRALTRSNTRTIRKAAGHAGHAALAAQEVKESVISGCKPSYKQLFGVMNLFS
ncbi:hypothetical protein ERJ75_000453700 [Trypanosoma vivax]|nr:hypothetical protein ERJ75_000453700 [Trypanosoma vivax]